MLVNERLWVLLGQNRYLAQVVIDKIAKYLKIEPTRLLFVSMEAAKKLIDDIPPADMSYCAYFSYEWSLQMAGCLAGLKPLSPHYPLDLEQTVSAIRAIDQSEQIIVSYDIDNSLLNLDAAIELKKQALNPPALQFLFTLARLGLLDKVVIIFLTARIPDAQYKPGVDLSTESIRCLFNAFLTQFFPEYPNLQVPKAHVFALGGRTGLDNDNQIPVDPLVAKSGFLLNMMRLTHSKIVHIDDNPIVIAYALLAAKLVENSESLQAFKTHLNVISVQAPGSDLSAEYRASLSCLRSHVAYFDQHLSVKANEEPSKFPQLLLH